MGFLVNGMVGRVPAKGNLNIMSSSVWRSSNIHFPRQQPNTQASCGRGRNSVVVEAGSWKNKLNMTQKSMKGASRGLQPAGATAEPGRE